MHNVLKKIVPFLYERNWYTGQLEFSRSRGVLFGAAVFFVLICLLFLWYETRPIFYVQ